MKDVLVTGGLGYIGSHIVVKLLRHGFNPVILDDMSNSRPETFIALNKIAGRTIDNYCIDVREINNFKTIWEHYEFYAVIHLAALKSVPDSYQRPDEYYDVNVNGICRLLEWCESNEIKIFIHSSSSAVYGETEEAVTELHPFGEVDDPYSKSKQLCEDILQNYKDKMVIFPLRYFNPVGSLETLEIGENPSNIPDGLFPVICRAHKTGDTVKIFGNNYRTKDGTPVRDYVHVIDVASAHILPLIKYNKSILHYGFYPYNIGTHKGYTVLEVLQKFNELGYKVNYEVGNRRMGDVGFSIANNRKFLLDFGFKPCLNLDEMIRSHIEFYLKIN